MRALTTIALMIAAAPALAQPPAGALVHPLYAELPGSMRNADAKRAFSEAVARIHLGAVEGMEFKPGSR